MSVSKCFTVHCNDCSQWVQAVEDQPLASFRRVVARMGWTTQRRRPGHRSTIDKCPACNKATTPPTQEKGKP